MPRWTREDGRFYFAKVAADLFGLVVLVCYGGITRARVRSFPAESVEDAERILAEIGRRRKSHGYRCEL
jgi:hypothetical protein